MFMFLLLYDANIHLFYKPPKKSKKKKKKPPWTDQWKNSNLPGVLLRQSKKNLDTQKKIGTLKKKVAHIKKNTYLCTVPKG